MFVGQAFCANARPLIDMKLYMRTINTWETGGPLLPQRRTLPVALSINITLKKCKHSH